MESFEKQQKHRYSSILQRLIPCAAWASVPQSVSIAQLQFHLNRDNFITVGRIFHPEIREAASPTVFAFLPFKCRKKALAERASPFSTLVYKLKANAMHSLSV